MRSSGKRSSSTAAKADASAPLDIQHEDGVWMVEGPWLQRLMANVNFADYESRMWFDKMLRESGLFRRLEGQLLLRLGRALLEDLAVFRYHVRVCRTPLPELLEDFRARAPELCGRISATGLLTGEDREAILREARDFIARTAGERGW